MRLLSISSLLYLCASDTLYAWASMCCVSTRVQVLTFHSPVFASQPWVGSVLHCPIICFPAHRSLFICVLTCNFLGGYRFCFLSRFLFFIWSLHLSSVSLAFLSLVRLCRSVALSLSVICYLLCHHLQLSHDLLSLLFLSCLFHRKNNWLRSSHHSLLRVCGSDKENDSASAARILFPIAIATIAMFYVLLALSVAVCPSDSLSISSLIC